jgi:hypothetical protein
LLLLPWLQLPWLLLPWLLLPGLQLPWLLLPWLLLPWLLLPWLLLPWLLLPWLLLPWLLQMELQQLFFSPSSALVFFSPFPFFSHWVAFFFCAYVKWQQLKRELLMLLWLVCYCSRS